MTAKAELIQTCVEPEENRALLDKARVLAVAVVGPPGAGKTALIEATARQLRGRARVAVVTLNPAAERDADRVSRYCDQVRAVKTAAPTATDLAEALADIKLDRTDILFIESIGGISGKTDLGQDQTVTVLGVTGGDDKAAEYGKLLAETPVLVLTQADLRRQVNFDMGAFRGDVRRINPTAQLIEVSAFESTGLRPWLDWLDWEWRSKCPSRRVAGPLQPMTEMYVG